MNTYRPIGFFVHHQGQGHIARCCAIADQLALVNPDREVVIFCARADGFDVKHPNCRVVGLPDFHSQSSQTDALHQQPLASSLDCAPLGVSALRVGMSRLSQWLGEADPALLVVDISSEVAILARICSVPVVLVRLHGDRDDAAHDSAHSGAIGILAPFDERLEQSDWPDHYRAKTFYTGGLVRRRPHDHDRHVARSQLNIQADRYLVVVISGNGGGGANLASLSMAARAIENSEWHVLGKVRCEGHETAFHNLKCMGWMDDISLYLAAADLVIISPGDTLVHEIACVGKPLVCIAEWCYYNEQRRKAEALEALGVAVAPLHWPGSFGEWRAVVSAAMQCDLDVQRSLVTPDAADICASYLEERAAVLWRGESEQVA